MLSGGLDTRFIQNCCINGSFTLSYSDNREKRTAEKIAQIVNMKHESIKIKKIIIKIIFIIMLELLVEAIWEIVY